MLTENTLGPFFPKWLSNINKHHHRYEKDGKENEDYEMNSFYHFRSTRQILEYFQKENKRAIRGAYPDSNRRKQLHKLLCYRYTIGTVALIYNKKPNSATGI